MYVCTLLQTDNHAGTPQLSFFTGRMLFLPPNQQRQSTEGLIFFIIWNKIMPLSPYVYSCADACAADLFADALLDLVEQDGRRAGSAAESSVRSARVRRGIARQVRDVAAQPCADTAPTASARRLSAGDSAGGVLRLGCGGRHHCAR